MHYTFSSHTCIGKIGWWQKFVLCIDVFYKHFANVIYIWLGYYLTIFFRWTHPNEILKKSYFYLTSLMGA